MSFHGPWPVASSLWRSQREEYFCEHICPSQEIIKTRRVGTKDVWEETKSFIVEEDDLGGSAKSLLIWMAIMIMILSINNVGKREIFVCFSLPSQLPSILPYRCGRHVRLIFTLCWLECISTSESPRHQLFKVLNWCIKS